MPWPLLAAEALRRLRLRFRDGALAAAASLLFILGALTWRQCLIWSDPLSLWSHAAEVAPDSSIARLNVGDALAAQGRFEEAAANLSAAVAINPACVAAQKRLASGGVDAAEASKLRGVLMANPVCLEAYGDLVTLRASRGEDMDGAEAFFESLLDWGLRRPGLESNLAMVRAAKLARKTR
jgi:tetratricopeptide (TPR) repeat protein